MRIRIIPYRSGSESAKMLAEALTTRLRYKVWRGGVRVRKANLCWGYSGDVGIFDQERFINHPHFIQRAADKLQTFGALHEKGVSHVPYTASKEEAQAWLAQGSTVFARTTGGQGGAGIVIVGPNDPLPDRPLYTQYVKKKKEFRVHVVGGSVIDVQQKRKRRELVDLLPERNTFIRNLANGWVFCHEDVVEPSGLRELGVAAVSAVGLDFGAVDIIWNERQNQCYVLEVNTAPGLCQTTCDKYADAFVEKYHAQRS